MLNIYNKDKIIALKNVNIKININEIKFFFKRFGKCVIQQSNEKKDFYIKYTQNNNIEEILLLNKKWIEAKFGYNVKCFKVEKIPLELNSPSNVLLIIFFSNTNIIEIKLNFILNLLKDFQNIEKIALFKKKKSVQCLVKVKYINTSIEMKKIITSNDKNMKIKVYYTDKQDIVINENNSNEKDFTDEKSKNLKKNNSKIDTLESNNNNNGFKFFGDLSKGCLYIKNKTKLKSNEIFNFFSLFGNVIKVKASNNLKRMLIFFKENNDFIKIYNKLKLLPKDFFRFQIILPKFLLLKVHDYFLYGKDNWKKHFFNISNQDIIGSTLKNLDISLNNDEILNKNLFEFNYKFIDQRKFIKKNKKYNFKVNNILWIKNLPDNLNLWKLDKYFRSKINIKENIFFLFIKKIKKNYIFICKTIQISTNVLMKFHKAFYKENILSIQFANNKILKSLKLIFDVKFILELPNNNMVKEYNNRKENILVKNSLKNNISMN